MSVVRDNGQLCLLHRPKKDLAIVNTLVYSSENSLGPIFRLSDVATLTLADYLEHTRHGRSIRRCEHYRRHSAHCLGRFYGP
jgi:hypothetical protein